ncbi:MAG: septal ring lytic transglycosylase RlpA family protein [Stellaceae bacterium]
MVCILYGQSAKTRPPHLCLAVLAAASLSACATVQQGTASPSPPPLSANVQTGCTPSFAESGIASWYGEAFQMKATASGEPFDMDKLTAAHRCLPINTIVRVTNLQTGKSAVLRINDRGPYVGGRVLDVSRYAAQRLGMKRRGVAPVRIEVFDLDRRDSDPNGNLAPGEPVVISGSSLDTHFPVAGTIAERH